MSLGSPTSPPNRAGVAASTPRSIANLSTPAWVLLALLAGGFCLAQPAIEAPQLSGADAQRGRAVLEARHCLDCHALGGSGAGIAPDLARRSITAQHTPSELAALIWNHGPEMWDMMEARSLQVEPLSKTDADAVFAYFWALRYFDPRGDAIRGKELFASKQCASCHGLTSQAGLDAAPPVSEWSGVNDAVLWSQQLWNHSTSMEQAMAQRGMKWPTFTEQEMVDLLVYLQHLPSTRDDPRRLEISHPETGRAVFMAKRCATCHTLDAQETEKTRLAGELKNFNTLSGFTAAMWNHAHGHSGRLPGGPSEAVAFSGSEMQTLVSYLYLSGAFEEGGNADAGRKVFADAGCQSCHGNPATHQPAAPITGEVSAARMASAVWSHGPQMLDAMKRHQIRWPTLSGRQMADLIAFLDRDSP